MNVANSVTPPMAYLQIVSNCQRRVNTSNQDDRQRIVIPWLQKCGSGFWAKNRFGHPPFGARPVFSDYSWTNIQETAWRW